MKRLLSGTVTALVVLAAGALASACDVTPSAASANGATISVTTLNSQLRALQSTVAGACLLQLENPQLTSYSGEGAGGSGTYTVAFADAVLDNQVGDLLAGQYAAARGITVSSSDLATSKSDFEATLDGEISAAVQQSGASGTTSYCQLPNGANITGAQLLAGLPPDLAAGQVHNQAVDDKLLAQGADLSASAVFGYYLRNPAQFTVACLSVIATDTQAHANQIVAQLNGGAPFAAVAKASSLDSQSAANGGALGCNYTVAQVKQALQVQAVTAGTPLAPVQDTSSGEWIIYEVTSQSVEPLSAATSVIRRELLQTTSNVNRVSKAVVGFARHSDVAINPQYGTWKALTIVAPVAPPPEYLLASVSGGSSGSSSSLSVNGAGTGGTSGTSGTTGTSGTSGTSDTTGGG